jgi:integrase
MHNATPVQGELAGIAWLREWQLPYEGAYTLLLKFAVANATRAGELCEAVFGQTLNQGPTFGRIHSRSLLDTNWIDQSGERGIAAMRRLTIESSMVSRAGQWTSLIASDKLFRYCPECLRYGFQSFLYQIDALAKCPIHGVPILAHCTKCGQATSPYALAEVGFGIPFHCPSCLAPYSEEVDMAQWVNHELYSDAVRLLAPIAKWVHMLAGSTLNWREWHTWDLPISSLTNQREKRRATMQILAAAIPPDFGQDILEYGGSTFKLYKGGFETALLGHSLTQRSQFIDSEIRADRARLYKAVRRRLARMTKGLHLGKRAPLDRRVEVHDGDGAMVLSTLECPYAQAFTLWRYHFEEMLGSQRILELRESALQWPWRGVADAGAWVGYLLASFCAAVNAFVAWREAATILNDTSVTGDDRVRARELHTLFAPIVTPIRQPNFPAVSFLTYVNEKGVLSIFVVGPAKNDALVGIEAWALRAPGQQQKRQRQNPTSLVSTSVHADLVAVKTAQERPFVRREYFWPLDMIRLPTNLDGSELQAKLRISGPAMIKAKNDLEAIQQWLNQYSYDRTRKDHEAQVQKVLLWCVAQRNIALSAMTTDDVDAFAEFLAAPEPRDIWLPTKLQGKARSWSPMRALPSPATQECVLMVISVMFKCWHAWGYILRNPFDGSKFSLRRGQKVLIEGPGTPRPTERFLSVTEWRYLINAVPEHTAISLAAARFILCIAYYGALKPSEIGCIKLGDLHFYHSGGNETDIWSVRINSRKPGMEEVFLLSEVAGLIANAMPVERSLVVKYLRLHRDDLLRNLFGIEYAGTSADDSMLMGNRLGIAVKPVFQAASELALAAGDETAAERLRQATLIWVSASLWRHIPASFSAGIILWQVLGTKILLPSECQRNATLRRPFNHRLISQHIVSLQKAVAQSWDEA